MKIECKKVSFINENYANSYIKKLKKTSNRDIKPVRSYLCEDCLKWHLTSIQSNEVTQLVYRERQIKNLKKTIESLNEKIEELKKDIENYKYLIYGR